MEKPQHNHVERMQVEVDKINTKMDLLFRQSQTSAIDIQEATSNLAYLITEELAGKDRLIASLEEEIKSLKEQLNELQESSELDIAEAES